MLVLITCKLKGRIEKEPVWHAAGSEAGLSATATPSAAATDQSFPTPTLEMSVMGGDLRRRALHHDSSASQIDTLLQPQRSISVAMSHSNLYGLLIAILGGFIYSLFTSAYNIAVNDQFHLLPSGVPSLSVYCANFYFALGLFSTSALFNVISMQYPLFGSAQSNLWRYLRDNQNRLWCVLAGFLAWLGDATQFMGGQLVGYSTALLVQAYPLVSTLLGILLFHEFWGCSRRAALLLTSGVVSYAAAICLLVLSARNAS
jgi:hypothetical protein